MIILILILNFILGITTQTFANEENFNLQSSLDKISYKDKEKLENLFKYFICSDHFGYVLFGSKPMVCTDFELNIIYITVDANLNNKFIKYAPTVFYFKYWQKYQHLFRLRNYIFKVNKSIDASCYNVVFINKKLFSKVVNAYIDRFKEVLGENITPESLLTQIVSNLDDILYGVLKGRHDLFGILLGFGEHNSKQFQRINNMRQQLKFYHKPPYDWDAIYNKCNFPEMNVFFESDPRLLYIQPPCFFEDLENSESCRLHTEYLKKWKELHEFYSTYPFLETTLKALTSE